MRLAGVQALILEERVETTKLKRFARFARRSLIEQISARLKLVLAEDSMARRESIEAIRHLEQEIKSDGEKQVIERVAYTWFNRFCALRFMDMNRYTRARVVSPLRGQIQPEILAEAKMGHIDEDMAPDKARQQIAALLDGKAPSRDPQGEAYRLLVVAACNFWSKAMPFLFQRIDDYTELLMPDDLLSGNSILAHTREAMAPDTCKEVEVIGWLYQFYISEKKDEVFEGLKKNRKIEPENIPAATQLFTPHWIVRYLVENSLGRLWMLNRPGSKLSERMDYYIRPAPEADGKEQPETDFLKISNPEEIKVCDPACGSGHILTYAFDLLYAIYEEEGYDPAAIPEKILDNNLYGIEIDERAGELAAFALTMKARSRQRRFFDKRVKPKICVLENIHFKEDELHDYMEFIGRDLFTEPLQTTLRQFEEADNFGSLIRPEVTDVDGMLQMLEARDVSGQLFLSDTHKKVLQALRQADYLSPKYHAVIANPPYMGGKGMNRRLSAFLKREYSDFKTDLFSSYVVRSLELCLHEGVLGFMTPFTWMFLGSFEKLREKILKESEITSLVQPELHAFFDSAFVSVCAYCLFKAAMGDRPGTFIDLSEFYGADIQPVRALEAVNNTECRWRYTVRKSDFRKLSGSPIAYSLPIGIRELFQKYKSLGELYSARQGLATTDNGRFVRIWSEVSDSRINKKVFDKTETSSDEFRWFPYNKGGVFRKWWGNQSFVVDWQYNGERIKESIIRKYPYLNGNPNFVAKNQDFYFRSSVSFSKIGVGYPAFRLFPNGFIFDVAGSSIFSGSKSEQMQLIAFCNTVIARKILKSLAPTLNIEIQQIKSLPLGFRKTWPEIEKLVENIVEYVQLDWDSYENSWDFTNLPLLNPDYRQPTLQATYQKLRAHWRKITLEMQRLEEENNRIFIDAYGLQDELTPEVPLNEITLTCNPHYRYAGDRSEDELEALLLADTMRELVSYAVGCMFGRYALDKPGLILANQGETIEGYLKQVPEPSFPADDDNVIPMLDGDWFTDDITERFCRFLRVAFGGEHYQENLQFVEKALNIKGKRDYSIRNYFLSEFYNDHVKRYRKRPIYWLFSSPKGNFNVLIYMHRYRPDTVSVVLNDYLREFRAKLSSRKNHLEALSISASASQGEKTKALKEIVKTTRMIAEMEEYEREVLYPLATGQVEIDLDDGVKANYPKLGAALKKIAGLEAKED